MPTCLGGEFQFLTKSGCGLPEGLSFKGVEVAACWPFDLLKYLLTKATVVTTPSISVLTASLLSLPFNTTPSHMCSFTESLGHCWWVLTRHEALL